MPAEAGVLDSKCIARTSANVPSTALKKKRANARSIAARSFYRTPAAVVSDCYFGRLRTLPTWSLLNGSRRFRFLVAPQDWAIHRPTACFAPSGSVRLHDDDESRGISGRRRGPAFQPDA